MSQPQIYKLTNDAAQTSDDVEAAFKLVSPPNLFSYRPWDAQNRDLPRESRPIFYSFYEPFDSIDYPINYECLTILSRNAIGIIEQVSPKHGCQLSQITLINTMLDECDDPREGLTDDEDIIRESLRHPQYFSEQYYAVNPPVIQGLFDRERSHYELSSSGDIMLVSKFAFHKQEDPLPPIFMLQEWQGAPFVTSALRDAWKIAGIRGTAYSIPEYPWRAPEVDIDL